MKILLVLATCTLWWLPLSLAKTLDKLVASVNSSPILFSDLQAFKKSFGLRAQLDPFLAESRLSATSKESQILEYLVDEKLILSQFPVSDAEVEQEINSIQSNNKINRASLKTAIQQQGFRFEDYFELIRVGTAKRNLIDRDIRSKMSINDEDIKNYYLLHRKEDGLNFAQSHVYVFGFSSKNKAELALKSFKNQKELLVTGSKLASPDLTPNGGDLDI
jgi:parvulin-like peptidyl-prolyl isomerase